jgi:phosphotriesterase-related protein
MSEVGIDGGRYLVRTVDGDIELNAPCTVLPHEHIQVGLPPADEPRLDDRTFDAAQLAEVVEFLSPLHDYDVGLLVDATAPGVGRNPALIQGASRELAIAIMLSTGLWKERGHPDWARGLDRHQLAERMVGDIEVGIGASGIRAGLIKVASGPVMSDAEREAFHAAAIAQRSTGVAVTTHTEGLVGREQLGLLLDEGVQPDRIIIGHLDMVNDRAYHAELASSGAFIEFDRVGATHDIGDQLRVEVVVAAIDQGYARNILLSHDSHAITTGYAEGRRPFTTLFDDFLPQLRAAGVDDKTLDLIVRENPLRAFGTPIN